MAEKSTLININPKVIGAVMALTNQILNFALLINTLGRYVINEVRIRDLKVKSKTCT